MRSSANLAYQKQTQIIMTRQNIFGTDRYHFGLKWPGKFSQSNFHIPINVFRWAFDLSSANVHLKFFERYNQTHFHNRSGIFNAKEIAFEANSLVDNRFEEHVISNLNGKLRLVFRLMLRAGSLIGHEPWNFDLIRREHHLWNINLETRLRNRNTRVHCFCRQVTEPSLTIFFVMISIW